MCSQALSQHVARLTRRSEVKCRRHSERVHTRMYLHSTWPDNLHGTSNGESMPPWVIMHCRHAITSTPSSHRHSPWLPLLVTHKETSAADQARVSGGERTTPHAGAVGRFAVPRAARNSQAPALAASSVTARPRCGCWRPPTAAQHVEQSQAPRHCASPASTRATAARPA